MEETAHTASIKKTKRTGDTFLTARCQKVKKDMQMWQIPADFWTALAKGLQHLSQDIRESMSPPLTFQISLYPIRNHLRAAFQEKNAIKWTNLLKGCLSHKWQQFATAHVRSKKVYLRAQEWGPNFVTAMWDYSLRIWKFRNGAFHGDANTQVKHYKLEELEREKARLSNRHTELQPTLDMIVKNVGQPSPNSFSTKLNPDSHPQTMNSYHGI
jgi:hypothetical protein